MEQEKDYGMEFKIRAVELGRRIGFKKAEEELGVDLGMLRGWSGNYKRYKNEEEMKLMEKDEEALQGKALEYLADQCAELEENIACLKRNMEFLALEPKSGEGQTEQDEQGKFSDLFLREQMMVQLEEMQAELDWCKQTASAQGQKISEHSSQIAILRFEMQELADKRGKLFLPIWLPIGIAAIIGAAVLKRKE